MVPRRSAARGRRLGEGHMAEQLRGGADQDDLAAGNVHEVSNDLAYKRMAFVNVVFYGKAGAGDRGWVLIDTGIPGSAGFIADAAEERFGKGARPSAIVLTHAHFDHAGALKELAERWDTPIYAHELELPYLDGSSAYPHADPAAGGGLMAALSRYYPQAPIDVRPRLQTLPHNGTVPGMEGWVYLCTPGHTDGHVSLWRDADSTLIVGDAFITTRQELAYAVAAQTAEVHGPPMYYSADWREAQLSVSRLTGLDPEIVIAGHGPAMRGPQMREALHTLARGFEEIAIPEHAREVDSAA